MPPNAWNAIYMRCVGLHVQLRHCGVVLVHYRIAAVSHNAVERAFNFKDSIAICNASKCEEYARVPFSFPVRKQLLLTRAVLRDRQCQVQAATCSRNHHVLVDSKYIYIYIYIANKQHYAIL